MSKPLANLPARIRKLHEARERVANLKRGERLSSGPMARLLGVSWPTLREWTQDIPGFERSGAFTGGGNGIEYEFKPLRTIDFLIRHFDREQRDGEAKAKRIRRIAIGPGADHLEDLSLEDLMRMLKLTTQLQDQKERQGTLMPADETRSAVQRMFARMQQAGVRAAQEADPNGRWPPETRSIVENVVRTVLLNQERAAQDCLKELNGGAAING